MRLIDAEKVRNDFMNTVYAVCASDDTNDRANSIIDAFDSLPEVEAEPVKHGMQRTLKNDLQQCIDSFERIKNGGVGIADELVCQTCKRALEYIDKLDDDPVKYGKWEYDDEGVPRCSICGASDAISREDYEYRGGKIRDNDSCYCPNCGAKMDGGDDRT